MAAKRSRTRAHRRDRRKAKASGWAREGKTNMGSRVGHGIATVGHGNSTAAPAGRPAPPPAPAAASPRHALKVTVGELASGRRRRGQA